MAGEVANRKEQHQQQDNFIKADVEMQSIQY